MNAPALVLVHGYPFDHTLWERVTPLLSPELQVLTPDLRGFGGPSPSSAEPSLDRMADDLKSLLDQRGLDRAVLAGMSMGGYVGLAFAERYPDRLAGFGLVSSQPQADTDEARAGRRAMIGKVRSEGPPVAAQAVIPKMFAPAHISDPDLISYPQLGAERAGAEGLAWALEAMARRPDRSEVLQRLAVPILILHGVADQLIPVDRARQLARSLSGAQYVEVPDAGHGTPLEAPSVVAQALMALVRRSFQDAPL